MNLSQYFTDVNNGLQTLYTNSFPKQIYYFFVYMSKLINMVFGRPDPINN